MKFLCLCRYDIATFSKLTPKDFQEIAAICAPHDRAMRESGHVDMIGSLAAPNETMVLCQNRSGHVEVDPRVYQNEAEPVGAFFIIEADDLEHGLTVAKLHPGNFLGARFRGRIEIFPVSELWMAH